MSSHVHKAKACGFADCVPPVWIFLFTDLVWSDPEDVDTWAMSPRGAGWLFGSKVTNEVSCFLLQFVKQGCPS